MSRNGNCTASYHPMHTSQLLSLTNSFHSLSLPLSLSSPQDEAGLLQLLEEQGVVDRVMQSLQLSSVGEEREKEEKEVEGEVEEAERGDDRLDKMTGEGPPRRGKGSSYGV